MVKKRLFRIGNCLGINTPIDIVRKYTTNGSRVFGITKKISTLLLQKINLTKRLSRNDKTLYLSIYPRLYKSKKLGKRKYYYGRFIFPQSIVAYYNLRLGDKVKVLEDGKVVVIKL